jgi:hypothetical protein
MAGGTRGAGPGNRSAGMGLNYDQGFTSTFYATGGGGGARGPAPQIDNTAAQLRGQKEIEGMRQAGENSRAQLSYQASTLPALLQQGRYQQLLPWAQAEYAASGGTVGPAPEISVGPVWNQQQVQQQVNSGRARNDQAAQTQMRETQNSLAGKGFGGNSPLLAALQNQTQMGNMAANSDMERETRWNAAEGNAGHVLDTQKARSDQYLGVEDIRQRRDQMRLSGLAAMLSAMI